MKKSFFISLCLLILVAILVSCGDKQPDNISDDMYKCGLAAIEIVDDYLDDRITLDVAQERLNRNIDHANNIADDNYEADSDVTHRLSDLLYCIWAKNRGTGTDSDIKEKRQELADLLGK